MIQGPPFQNTPPPPNKRLKGLILAAQIFSVFAFLGIIITFSWTARQITRRNRDHLVTEITRDMPSDAQVETDSLVSESPISSNSLSDENLLSQAQTQKAINESLYKIIKENTPDSTYNKSEVISSLTDLKIQSTRMSNQLESLYQLFKDTLDQSGVADAQYTTESFFVSAGRDRELKNELKNYREGVINELLNLNFSYMDELRTSMPLDDTNSTGYVVAWDPGKFSGSPADALTYLRELELEVRNFEAAALNKYPQTVPTY